MLKRTKSHERSKQSVNISGKGSLTRPTTANAGTGTTMMRHSKPAGTEQAKANIKKQARVPEQSTLSMLSINIKQERAAAKQKAKLYSSTN